MLKIDIGEYDMDIIIAVIVLVIVLVAQLMIKKNIKSSDSLYLRKYKEKKFTFSQKLLLASLTGFIIYLIFTPDLESILQKIVIIIVAVILIFAVHIQIPTHEETDHNKESKDI